MTEEEIEAAAATITDAIKARLEKASNPTLYQITLMLERPSDKRWQHLAGGVDRVPGKAEPVSKWSLYNRRSGGTPHYFKHLISAARHAAEAGFIYQRSQEGIELVILPLTSQCCSCFKKGGIRGSERRSSERG